MTMTSRLDPALSAVRSNAGSQTIYIGIGQDKHIAADTERKPAAGAGGENHTANTRTNACLRTSRGMWCRPRHAGALACGAAGLCARVRACAGAAESLHAYILMLMHNHPSSTTLVETTEGHFFYSPQVSINQISSQRHTRARRSHIPALPQAATQPASRAGFGG